MKSLKTFLPEYEALKRIRGVFYTTEKEYESVVYGEGGNPLRAAVVNWGQAETTTGAVVYAAEPSPHDIFQDLYEILRGHKGQACADALDQFAERFLGGRVASGDFRGRVLGVFNLPPDGLPARYIEQVIQGTMPFAVPGGGDHHGLGQRLMEWLVEVLEPLFDPLVEDGREEYEIPGQNGYTITRRVRTLYGRGLKSGEALVEGIEEIVGVNLEEVYTAGKRALKSSGVPAIDANLGTDAFGVYLPFHAFGLSKTTPWGIYLFLEPLILWAGQVWEETGKKHSFADILSLLFLVTYRHEMFHYHVERYAFALEVMNRKPHYRPYIEQVRTPVAKTEKWLEEALAQAVVLSSTFIKNRTFLAPRDVVKLLKNEFKKFGPGYKDFECKWTDGVGHGHRRLGSQIASGKDVTNSAEWVTDIAIPKGQYFGDMRAVPGYLGFSANIRSQFQFQTPRTDQVKRFWERNKGGAIDAATGSSHQNWTLGSEKVQFVDRNGHADLNSFKKMAKLLGVSVFQLKHQVQSF